MTVTSSAATYKAGNSYHIGYLFNGNVKSSNGLYKHLPMINDLNKEISKSYINILTKYLEKDIKEKNNQCFNHINNQLHDVLMKVWS